MALLLATFGDGDPEWVRKLKKQIRECSALDDRFAAQEKEARKNGDIRKLNTVLSARRRIDLEIQSRMALLGLHERNK